MKPAFWLFPFPVGHIQLLQHELAGAKELMVHGLHSLHGHSGFLWAAAHHLPLLPTHCYQGVYESHA